MQWNTERCQDTVQSRERKDDDPGVRARIFPSPIIYDIPSFPTPESRWTEFTKLSTTAPRTRFNRGDATDQHCRLEERIIPDVRWSKESLTLHSSLQYTDAFAGSQCCRWCEVLRPSFSYSINATTMQTIETSLCEAIRHSRTVLLAYIAISANPEHDRLASERFRHLEKEVLHINNRDDLASSSAGWEGTSSDEGRFRGFAKILLRGRRYGKDAVLRVPCKRMIRQAEG